MFTLSEAIRLVGQLRREQMQAREISLAVRFSPISLFADSSAGIAPVKKLSAVFAPFGRLIPCETVITVDSASNQTPIVGLVTENVYYGGKLVIPAGTEIHGTAQTDHQRERIASGNTWTFIWQNGMEMQIKAIALDREFDDETNQSGCAWKPSTRFTCFLMAISSTRNSSGKPARRLCKSSFKTESSWSKEKV
jgi:hypothetical protein